MAGAAAAGAQVAFGGVGSEEAVAFALTMPPR